MSRDLQRLQRRRSALSPPVKLMAFAMLLAVVFAAAMLAGTAIDPSPR